MPTYALVTPTHHQDMHDETTVGEAQHSARDFGTLALIPATFSSWKQLSVQSSTTSHGNQAGCG